MKVAIIKLRPTPLEVEEQVLAGMIKAVESQFNDDPEISSVIIIAAHVDDPPPDHIHFWTCKCGAGAVLRPYDSKPNSGESSVGVLAGGEFELRPSND